MPLPAQTRIGPYEILAPVGAGGMGEVYKARDTRLDRDVAIKVMPEAFAEDPERMARFHREAQVLASLNHPNIAALYGVEERALVMEFVEGPALSEKITAAPLPVKEALCIAMQIAEALEYAHAKSIVHRDLKPANIKLSPEGRVKLLDFGLAKALEPSGPQDNPATSPTVTIQATRAGIIMGTAGYMAPEQARGHSTDKRIDIWSFGVVLFELLAGRRLFGGPTTSDSLAAVLTREPAWDEIPSNLRPVLRRCLQKDPERRFHDMADVRLLLEEAAESATPLQVTGWHTTSAKWVWIVSALLGGFALALGFTHVNRREPLAPRPAVVQFQIPAPDGGRIEQFAFSPDGSHLALRSGDPPPLWIRDLNSLEVTPLAGTENATYPFWAPASDWLAYFRDGRLYKVALSGGPAQPIADAPNPRGGAWEPGGDIIFAPDRTGPLHRVSAKTGDVVPWTQLDESLGEDSHRWPCILPNRKVLYMRRSFKTGAVIWLGALDNSGAGKRLMEAESNIAFTPDRDGSGGYVFYVHDSALVARWLNVQTGEVRRAAVVVAERVKDDSPSPHYAFSVSQTGSLAYQTGKTMLRSRLTWVDRRGVDIHSVGTSGLFRTISLSPTGKKMVTVKAEHAGTHVLYDLWVIDTGNDTSTRFTFDGRPKINAIWSPDGARIAFGDGRPERIVNVSKSLAGGVEEPMPTPPQMAVISDWSSSGHLLFSDETSESYDLWSADTKPFSKPFRYIQAPQRQMMGRFSPDAKWVAYASNESGRYEIWIQSFPSERARWQISTEGGYEPVWRRDGKELFYRALDGKLMSVEIRHFEDSLEFSAPKALFNTGLGVATFGSNSHYFDVSMDGKQFLVNRPVEADIPANMTVVVNWTATHVQ